MIHAELFFDIFLKCWRNVGFCVRFRFSFQLPDELLAISCPTLEEFYLTLSGIRTAHIGFGKNNLMSLLGALLNANVNPRVNTIVFKLNAP